MKYQFSFNIMRGIDVCFLVHKLSLEQNYLKTDNMFVREWLVASHYNDNYSVHKMYFIASSKDHLNITVHNIDTKDHQYMSVMAGQLDSTEVACQEQPHAQHRYHGHSGRVDNGRGPACQPPAPAQGTDTGGWWTWHGCFPTPRLTQPT